MSIAALNQKVLFMPWQYRQKKVTIRISRDIFKMIVRGCFNKYHVRVLFYLLKHKAPKNVYTLSKIIRSSPHRVKMALNDLQGMKLLDRDMLPTPYLVKIPTTKIFLSRPAYNFIFSSKDASLLMIRVLLVATKYYNKIDAISDINKWIDDHHTGRVEEVFTILRDKLKFLYAKKFCLITKTIKRKEAKENINIYNNIKTFNKSLVNRILLSSGNREEVFKILGGGKEKIYVGKDNEDLQITDIKQCDLKNLQKHINKILKERPTVLLDPEEYIVFEGKRIKSPFFEIASVFDYFEQVLNKQYVAKGVLLNRRSKANITVATKFYYFCKSYHLDIEWWMNEIYENWLKYSGSIKFTYIISGFMTRMYREDYQEVTTGNYIDYKNSIPPKTENVMTREEMELAIKRMENGEDVLFDNVEVDYKPYIPPVREGVYEKPNKNIKKKVEFVAKAPWEDPDYEANEKKEQEEFLQHRQELLQKQREILLKEMENEKE